EAVRGLEGIREAEVDFAGALKLKVAIAHGLANARKVCEMLRAGNPRGWNFIEIMACPGGCINGGGQPISLDPETPRLRIEALYRDDRNLPQRRSHDNPEIQALYQEFLGEPNSHRAHELLHTHNYQQTRTCQSK
ncbi:MAG: iron hydrogenase small subunit, partial [Mailhella sp.]